MLKKIDHVLFKTLLAFVLSIIGTIMVSYNNYIGSFSYRFIIGSIFISLFALHMLNFSKKDFFNKIIFFIVSIMFIIMMFLSIYNSDRGFYGLDHLIVLCIYALGTYHNFDLKSVKHIIHGIFFAFFSIFYIFIMYKELVPALKKGYKLKIIILPVFLSLIFIRILSFSNPVWDDIVSNLLSYLWEINIFYLYLYFNITWVFLNSESLFTRIVNFASKRYSASQSIIKKSTYLIEKEQSFYIFLVMINIIFGFYVITDSLNFIFSITNFKLPEGYTYSKYVTDSMYFLTVNSAMVVGVFLIFPSTFTQNAKKIYKLIYSWIVLNLIILISCVFRIYMYIDNYGFTPTRIVGMAAILFSFIVMIFCVLKTNYIFNKKQFLNYLWIIGSVFIFIFSSLNLEKISIIYNFNNSTYFKEGGFKISHEDYWDYDALVIYEIIDNSGQNITLNADLKSKLEEIYTRLENDLKDTWGYQRNDLEYTWLYERIKKIKSKSKENL